MGGRGGLRLVPGVVPGAVRWIAPVPGRGYRFTGRVVGEHASGIAPPPIDAKWDTMGDPAPRPRADAERRQITVISCELIGTLGRADGAGLDDLRDAIAAFQRCVAATVDRHGGFVVDQL